MQKEIECSLNRQFFWVDLLVCSLALAVLATPNFLALSASEHTVRCSIALCLIWTKRKVWRARVALLAPIPLTLFAFLARLDRLIAAVFVLIGRRLFTDRDSMAFGLASFNQNFLCPLPPAIAESLSCNVICHWFWSYLYLPQSLQFLAIFQTLDLCLQYFRVGDLLSKPFFLFDQFGTFGYLLL